MDDDNNKMSDMWELDLSTEAFKELEIAHDSFTPSGRSGHSSNIYNEKLYIFGGILELTKEINEMLLFNF